MTLRALVFLSRVDYLLWVIMMWYNVTFDRGSPVKMTLKSLSQVRQVSAGNNHTVLLTTDGHVLTCGSNQVSNDCPSMTVCIV